MKGTAKYFTKTSRYTLDTLKNRKTKSIMSICHEDLIHTINYLIDMDYVSEFKDLVNNYERISKAEKHPQEPLSFLEYLCYEEDQGSYLFGVSVIMELPLPKLSPKKFPGRQEYFNKHFGKHNIF